MVLATVFVMSAAPALAGSPRVRILLQEEGRRVVVTGESLIIERGEGEDWKRVLKGVRAAAFVLSGRGLRLDGSDVSAPQFMVSSPEGRLLVDGRELRSAAMLVATDKGLSVINVMDMEDYLVGVVNGEIDSGWPSEAVMAQVVAARTYALYRTEAGKELFDLRSDVLDQVYAGLRSEDHRASEAVRRTRGQVLYADGALVPAFFHSSCGGVTADVGEVWGIPHPSLQSVLCGDCGSAPKGRWEVSLTVAEIRRALGALYPGGDQALTLAVARRSRDGRVAVLTGTTASGSFSVDTEDFRREIGYGRLLSTRFSVRAEANSVVFQGSGYGHGVGLCQWGAKGAADRGLTYREILSRYYPGAEIGKAY